MNSISHAREMRALVVDDLVRQCRSKKMDGVSIHYDQTENRSVKSHQAAQLRMRCEAGFFPHDAAE